MSGAVIGSTIINTVRGEDMGGVVAGSTMQDLAQSQKKWGALVINTGCNLTCPYCYLGKKNGNETMLPETAEKLVNYARKNWEGVVIVGTEPLLNEQSVEIVNIFAAQVKTHLITNGVNLEQFADSIKNVQRIDVSLDGGQRTYQRSGSFEQILGGARKWKKLSGGELFVIHVLSQENSGGENIRDMLEAGSLFGAEKTIFSPYIRTIGGSEVAAVSVKTIADSLRDFAEENWILIIDPYHALIEGRGWDEVRNDVSCLPARKVLTINFDPGDKIDRVDVNGNFHHPYLALHPGIRLSGKKMF